MTRTFARVASVLVPNLVTKFAFQKLTNPQVRKLRTHEVSTLDNARKDTYRFKDFDIQLYAWGTGSKTVLLIHGWEGQAGNFADLIALLLEKDYTVHAFDAPSHGYSSQGSTSLFEFTELVGILIRKFQVSQLVSHSFGGVATTFALFQNPDLTIEKYVLLTTPDKFTERIDDVATTVGITEGAKNRLIQKIERDLEVQVKTLNVSDFVKQIHVKSALIFHDRNDRVIPIARSKNVHKNWVQSEFRTVEGTGHFRILRTPAVLREVVSFLE